MQVIIDSGIGWHVVVSSCIRERRQGEDGNFLEFKRSEIVDKGSYS